MLSPEVHLVHSCNTALQEEEEEKYVFKEECVGRPGE